MIWEDRHAIQGVKEGVQWESGRSRRRTHLQFRGAKGVKKGCKGSQDPRETRRRTQGYKGSQEGVQWESRPSGRRTHHPRRGTKGVKKGYNGGQDPRAGGHLKKASRTPNSTLFGENHILSSVPHIMEFALGK